MTEPAEPAQAPEAPPDPEPPREGIDVMAGVAVHKDGTLSPIVVAITTAADGSALQSNLTPAQARHVGLDFLSAAVSSLHDVGMRRALARRDGGDGETARAIKAEVLAEVARVFAEEPQDGR